MIAMTTSNSISVKAPRWAILIMLPLDLLLQTKTFGMDFVMGQRRVQVAGCPPFKKKNKTPSGGRQASIDRMELTKLAPAVSLSGRGRNGSRTSAPAR